MTPAELDAVIDRVCRTKVRYPTRTAARRFARRYPKVHVYPCPFPTVDGDRHWHIGHTPSIDALARIADAIRARAQGAA